MYRVLKIACHAKITLLIIKPSRSINEIAGDVQYFQEQFQIPGVFDALYEQIFREVPLGKLQQLAFLFLTVHQGVKEKGSLFTTPYLATSFTCENIKI